MTIIAHSKQLIAIDDAHEDAEDVTSIDLRMPRAATGWFREVSAAPTEKLSCAFLSVPPSSR
jgi:hypothetical protein